MQSFEFDGQKYRQSSRHQKEWGRELIRQMNLSGTEYVLDLGCGDGVLSAEIAEYLPRGSVLGIDASPSMIAAAEELSSGNLSFLLLDIRDLDFEETFDIIFSNAALHWVHDHRKLAQASVRALKPGGRLCWNFAASGTSAAFCKIVQKFMASPEYKRYFQHFSWPWHMPEVSGYEHCFDGLPMAELHIREENRDRFFSSETEMLQWLDQPSLVPFLAALPEERKRPFRDAVADAMIRHCRQPDGRCFEQFRRIFLNGVKVS